MSIYYKELSSRVPQKFYGLGGIIVGFGLCFVGILLFNHYSRLTIILLILGIIIGTVGVSSFRKNFKYREENFAGIGFGIMVLAIIFIIISYICLEVAFSEGNRAISIMNENPNPTTSVMDSVLEIMKTFINYWFYSVLFALLSLFLFCIAVSISIIKIVKINKIVSITIYVALILAIVGIIYGLYISNQGREESIKFLENIFNIFLKDPTKSAEDIQNGAWIGGIFMIVSFCILGFGLFYSKMVIMKQKIVQPQMRYPYRQPAYQLNYQQSYQKQHQPKIVSCPNCSVQIQVFPMQNEVQCPRCRLKGSVGQQPQPYPQQQIPYQQPYYQNPQPQSVQCPQCNFSIPISIYQKGMPIQCPNCGLRGTL